MADDFLPHEPTPLPTPATTPGARRRKTLFLWLFLIVLFVGLYSLFAKDPQPRHAPGAPAVACDSSGFSGWWLVATSVIGLSGGFVFLFWQFGQTRKYARMTRTAYEAFTAGDYETAERAYGAVATEYRTRINHAATATYQRALALRHLGQADAALGLLVGIERTPGGGWFNVKHIVAIEIATCFALGGDIEKARRWLETARERGKTSSVMYTSAQLLAGCLVACREGRYDEALRTFEDSWRRLEGELTFPALRCACMLRAFALASTSSPRDSGAIDPWLAMLRTSPAGSLAYMTKHWPELALFAKTHGIDHLVAET